MSARNRTMAWTLAILLLWGAIPQAKASAPEDGSSESGICRRALDQCLRDPFVNVNMFGLIGCLGGYSFCLRFIEPLIR
jgi:hypothetical protein